MLQSLVEEWPTMTLEERKRLVVDVFLPSSAEVASLRGRRAGDDRIDRWAN